MKHRFVVYVAAVCVAASARTTAGDGGDHPAISADRILAHTERLASDQMEGRAPGTRGEARTLDYLTGEFEEMGFEPGNPDGGYLQRVPLIGTTVTNSPALLISGGRGPALRLAYGPDCVVWAPGSREEVVLEGAELVFAGYGVVAPEYGWDDYKDLDVTGKIVVVLVGDPPHPDPDLFAGRAMTYYGRWTYKFETAAARGAAGAVVVHTEAEAGYPWAVVENSWTGEQFSVPRADAEPPRCTVEAWISEEAVGEVFTRAGKNFTDACADAVSDKFRPYSLGLFGSAHIESDSREVTSHNVVALLPGGEPGRSREHVVYTAHWDHLGVGRPVDGDSIYNGALDNASGVAGALEIARAFAARRDDLGRSILFVLTTAEESGLLGARYYVEHPVLPLEYAVAMINVDGLNIWGRTTDMIVVGFGQSNLDDYLADAAAAQGRSVRADAEPEKGYYYRSDHFPFARKGVPALYAGGGVEYRGQPAGWGAEVRTRYLAARYHKPHDEIGPGWDLSGAVEDLDALFRVGFRLSTSVEYPRWSTTSEFNRAWERLIEKRGHGAAR